jgi:hypothetical protein
MFQNHIWKFNILWWYVILRSAIPILISWSFNFSPQTVPNLECVFHNYHAQVPFTSGTFIFYLAHPCALKQVCQIILWICQISFCLCQFLNDFSYFFMTHCFYELSRSFIIIWVFLFSISRCQFVNECATLFCGQSLLLPAQSYIFGDHSYFFDSSCQIYFEYAK